MMKLKVIDEKHFMLENPERGFCSFGPGDEVEVTFKEDGHDKAITGDVVGVELNYCGAWLGIARGIGGGRQVNVNAIKDIRLRKNAVE